MRDSLIKIPKNQHHIEASLSPLAQSLEPVGRILEDPDYNVWGCSPIFGPDGKVHVFYSRWKNIYGHYGWVAACEIGHAVADSPEGPYQHLGIVLEGRGGNAWDSWSIHNPTIHQVGDKFLLFYMGSNGSDLGVTLEEITKMTPEEYKPYFIKLVKTKQVGMAIADSLDGPWERVGDEPIIKRGESGQWDDLCSSNPAFLQHPNGQYWLYYKGWDYGSDSHNGNRKYGLAIADNLTGPYIKHESNPLISFAHIDPHMQCEDAYVWYNGEKYQIILRDMGFFNHEYGLLLESVDGLEWSDPSVAFLDAPTYFKEVKNGLDREGRFERPQMLIKDGQPQYLFCAFRGGKYNTSSGVVLKISNNA